MPYKYTKPQQNIRDRNKNVKNVKNKNFKNLSKLTWRDEIIYNHQLRITDDDYHVIIS